MVYSRGEHPLTKAGNSRRKYDAEDTQARLVLAAQRAFTRAKFEDVNVRELARSADANPALVNRYFGSKKGLFEACFTDLQAQNPLQAVPINRWSEFLADMLVGKMGSAVDFDPLLAMLRSSQSLIVGDFVRETLRSHIIEPFNELMPHDESRDAKGRALLALILGVDVIERMFKLEFAQEAKPSLKSIYAVAIAAIVKPQLP